MDDPPTYITYSHGLRNQLSGFPLSLFWVLFMVLQEKGEASNINKIRKQENPILHQIFKIEYEIRILWQLIYKKCKTYL